jgi:xylulose-5-phosphate/fructose-6-phosphate phosphoketolase
MDRFQLAIDTIHRIPGIEGTADAAIKIFQAKLVEHKAYITSHGEDLPEVVNWRWNQD